jgi:metal-responsive CopG/Arc/MetJ family transcriptional regulator
MWIMIAIVVRIKELIVRTIQMTLDEDLVSKVDDIVYKLETTRSAFTRDALREAVEQYNTLKLEEKHRKGYLLHPGNKEEFAVWEEEQNWGDQ